MHKRLIGSLSFMNPEIQTAHDYATRVVKKQRLCAQNTTESLDRLIHHVVQLQQKLQTQDWDVEETRTELERLQSTIDEEELLKGMNKDTRELHSATNKLGKVRQLPTSFPSTACHPTWISHSVSI